MRTFATITMLALVGCSFAADAPQDDGPVLTFCQGWRPTTVNGDTDCPALCENPVTSAACFPTRGVAQLCECIPCTTFRLKDPAPAGAPANCDTVCIGASDLTKCDEFCECADTPVPTVVAVPVPRQDGRIIKVVRRVLRLKMNVLKAALDTSKLGTALLQVLKDETAAVHFHWTCPLTACLFGCPRTETDKLALGCTSELVLTPLGRALTVLAGETGSTAEVTFEYKAAFFLTATGTAREAKIVKKVDDSKAGVELAPFKIQQVEFDEVEILIANPNYVAPTPKPTTTTAATSSSDDDGLKGWEIALIVIGCVLATALAGGAVFYFCNNKYSKVENEEPHKALPGPVRNEPVTVVAEE